MPRTAERCRKESGAKTEKLRFAENCHAPKGFDSLHPLQNLYVEALPSRAFSFLGVGGAEDVSKLARFKSLVSH